ncbi:MAG: chalcone isomerase family protein [Pseudomonadota bacterium]|nr:chalcone isomerase family protein [Pseudomonadota bacterium]
MNRVRRDALAAGAALFYAAAWAQPLAPQGVPPEVAAALPGAQMQGSGTLRVLFFRVYDAVLWRGEQAVGTDFATTPLAVEAVYARQVDHHDLVEKTLEQLRLQTSIEPSTAARWRQQLQPLLPTVQSGDRLTALNEPGRGLQMFLNGRATGRIDDPRLAALFFGIWLSPQTSQPELRQALLGETAPAR